MIVSIIFETKYVLKIRLFLTYRTFTIKCHIRRHASHTRLAPADEGSKTSTVTQQRLKPSIRKSFLSCTRSIQG